ncbi:MAG TPA: hypothetical protein DD640_07140 [Clostridiales bacterium]|nr:hypothetical protein [Clostridiales bacterium]
MKLSKREVIMLTLLLIIALVFIEYRFILKPGLETFKKLQTEENDLINTIDNINFDLTVAKAMEKTRDENLTEIVDLSVPFLDGVAPDALLVFTHAMLQKHGFNPSIYGPSPLQSQLLTTDEATITRLTYRIKEIAVEYQALHKEAGEPTGGETAPAVTDKEIIDEVERYSVQVVATGTFAQIKELLDDFDSLNRTIIINSIYMTPVDTITGLLDIEFWVNYYGIEKLEPSDDPLNKWTRESQPVSTADPYVALPTPTPAPTEETAETTAETAAP